MLQNDGGGLGVDVVGVPATFQADGAGMREAARRFLRTVSLVDKDHGHAVALMQLRGEPARTAAGRLFGAIERQGQADHEGVRQPGLLQRVDDMPLDIAVAYLRGGHGAGAAGDRVADGDADDAAADVETQRATHAWPAYMES